MMRFAQLKIVHKLVATLILVSGFALVVMGLLTYNALTDGFLSYLRQMDEDKQTSVAEALLDEYRLRGDWSALQRNPSRWHRLIREIDRGIENRDRFRPPPPRHGEPPGPNETQTETKTYQVEIAQDAIEPVPTYPFSAEPLERRLSLLDKDRHPIFGSAAPTDDAIFRAIELGGKTVGWLAVVPLQEISAPRDLRFLQDQARIIVLVTIGLLLLAIVIAAFMARQLVRPLRHLAAASHKLSEGLFQTRVSIAGRDELAALARDFNNLAYTLERNEQARQRWTADISHELRTPITVMRAELEALRDGIRQPDEEAIDSLLYEVRHLGQIVNDLYELALADVGALTYNKTLLDPSALACKVATGFTSRIREQGLELRYQPASEPTQILGDERRLTQLFTNLLENCCRYTDAPGVIHLHANRRQGFLDIHIEDTPPAPSQCANLFDRLFREESSRNRAKGGAGLGLALCRTIVDAHEGTISAAPSNLGGLHIKITFPVEAS